MEEDYRDKLSAWLRLLHKGINPVTGKPSTPEIRHIACIKFDVPGGIKAIKYY